MLMLSEVDQRAYDAQRDGRFKDEIIPIRVNSVEYTKTQDQKYTQISLTKMNLYALTPRWRHSQIKLQYLKLTAL